MKNKKTNMFKNIGTKNICIIIFVLCGISVFCFIKYNNKSNISFKTKDTPTISKKFDSVNTTSNFKDVLSDI